MMVVVMADILQLVLSGAPQMAVANRKIWMSGMTFRVERSARTACMSDKTHKRDLSSKFTPVLTAAVSPSPPPESSAPPAASHEAHFRI